MMAYDIAVTRAAYRGVSASTLTDDDDLLLAAGWPKQLTCSVCGALAETLKGTIEWDADAFHDVWMCAGCAKEAGLK